MFPHACPPTPAPAAEDGDGGDDNYDDDGDDDDYDDGL